VTLSNKGRLLVPTWAYMSAIKSPPGVVEGGREWPHQEDWALEVGGVDQGGDEAWIGEPSEEV
jgi:hypothetical protein